MKLKNQMRLKSLEEETLEILDNTNLYFNKIILIVKCVWKMSTCLPPHINNNYMNLIIHYIIATSQFI